MRRLVASIRLSRDTDATNSPGTQRADIEDWVAEHPGNRVDYWTEDLDVSGGMPMADRPGIGPFLSPDRLDQWDGIIGYRMDRLFRSQLDFLLWVRDLGKKHGKVVIDVEDGTDTSTPAGVRTLNDRVQHADYERQRMVERRTKSAKRIRQEGRWNGGLIPFGYTVERHEVKGWRLVPDPGHAPILKRMVADLLDGKSLNEIAAWLNAEGVPSPTDITRERYGRKATRGNGWKPPSVRAKLANPSCTGVTTHKGQIVLDAGGNRIMRAEPIIDAATHVRVLDILARHRGRESGDRPSRALLHIAFCGLCGGILYGKRNARNSYYQCVNATPARGSHPRCSARMMRTDELEPIVDEAVTDVYGDLPDMERPPNPAKDRDENLAAVGQAIADLTTERYVQGVIRPDFDEMMAGLRTEHDRLSALTAGTPDLEPVPTGKTVGEVWQASDAQAKRRYLLDRGWKVYAKRDPDGRVRARIETGELFADMAAIMGITTDEFLASQPVARSARR
jgi:site-specific DNA recombinase